MAQSISEEDFVEEQQRLRDEVQRLRDEQQQLRDEQEKLRQDATAAAQPENPPNRQNSLCPPKRNGPSAQG